MKFKLRPEDAPFISSSGSLEYIMLPPAKLVSVFGEPEIGDEFKVSGAYTFDTYNGGIITLYDWKTTTLYASESHVTPEELWASEKYF